MKRRNILLTRSMGGGWEEVIEMETKSEKLFGAAHIVSQAGLHYAASVVRDVARELEEEGK